MLLAAEPPSALYTRNIVEHTLRETLSELLSDQKVIDMWGYDDGVAARIARGWSVMTRSWGP